MDVKDPDHPAGGMCFWVGKIKYQWKSPRRRQAGKNGCNWLMEMLQSNELLPGRTSWQRTCQTAMSAQSIVPWPSGGRGRLARVGSGSMLAGLAVTTV